MKSCYISIQNKKYPIDIIKYSSEYYPENSSEHYPEHTHSILEFSSKNKINPLHLKEIPKNILFIIEKSTEQIFTISPNIYSADLNDFSLHIENSKSNPSKEYLYNLDFIIS